MGKKSMKADEQPKLKESRQNSLDKREVGKNIARIRDEQDMTQAELAEKVGVDSTMISKIESGKRNLLMSTFFTITAALHATPNEIGPQRFLVGTALEFYNKLDDEERDAVKNLILSLLRIRASHNKG